MWRKTEISISLRIKYLFNKLACSFEILTPLLNKSFNSKD